MMEQKYYVYVLCDPRHLGEAWGRQFKPFYVGKGSERRAARHLEVSSIRKGKSRGPTSEETKDKIRLSNIAAKVDARLSEDFFGKQFGMWTVFDKGRDLRPRIRGANGIYWKCRCSCVARTEREVSQSNLCKGTSISCGCRKKNLSSS